MSPKARSLVHRIIGGIDLLIDFATLGEYGLEELPANGTGCEGIGRTRIAPSKPRGAAPTGWEALAPARRGELGGERYPASPLSTAAIISRPTSRARRITSGSSAS